MNVRIEKRAMAGAGLRLPGAAAVALLVAVAAAHGPIAAQETGPGTDARLCMDDASADYNSCLMESTRFWHRKMCDLAYQADVLYCLTFYAGEVRDAYEGVR